MTRFLNKNLKAHSYIGNDKILDIFNQDSLNELTKLLTLHVNNLRYYSNDRLDHLIQKLDIQLGIKKDHGFRTTFISTRKNLKDLFLTLEIILESFYEIAQSGSSSYFNDFVADFNDFFLIHKIPLQIRYFPQKKEFYVEKVISPEVSEKIKETLEAFSKEDKVFNDFKESIKLFSSGDWEESIEKCCVSIEDYLCILLNKETLSI